jgi:hypothetical protein
MLSDTNKPFLLSVIMLNVVAPKFFSKSFFHRAGSEKGEMFDRVQKEYKRNEKKLERGSGF